MNAVEIEEAVSALAEQPFDAAAFAFQFLAAFGNKETTIRRLRTGATNASDVPGGGRACWARMRAGERRARDCRGVGAGFATARRWRGVAPDFPPASRNPPPRGCGTRR